MLLWLGVAIIAAAIAVTVWGWWLRPRRPSSIARGRNLDRLGENIGYSRIRGESDAAYRERIRQSMEAWKR
jgi:hypothetical protein